MNSKQAADIAFDLIVNNGNLGFHFQKWVICGSIRRQCVTVNDIDIVAIPKPENNYVFGEESLENRILSLDPKGKDVANAMSEGSSKRFMMGEKIKRFEYQGIMIDLYLATEESFETLRLIRTGSKEHNVRLTILARSKGMKLFASGKGLCTIKGGIYNNEPEEIIEVIDTTEDGILKNLLGKIPLPEERN